MIGRENITNVGRKLANIDYSGRKALKTEGGVSLFSGYLNSLGDRYGVTLRFTDEAETQLKERVGEEVLNTGKRVGIEFVLAGRNYPTHCTLLEGLYQGNNTEERNALYEGLSEKLANERIVKGLAGEIVDYKYLLLDKGNVLLTTIDIPSYILESREYLKEFYSQAGLKPLPLDNLLHISYARMASLPSGNVLNKLASYRQEMVRLRHQISSSPLQLVIREPLAKSSLTTLLELM